MSAGGHVDPAESGGDARHPELRPQRALEPKHLLNEVGDAVTVVPDEFLEVRPLAEQAQREGQKPHRRLLTAGEEIGGNQRGVFHLGRRAIRERRCGQSGQHVLPRVLAAVLNVLTEPFVEELEGLVGDLLVHSRQPLPEERVIGFRDALEVGYDGQGEGLCVGAHHLARSLLDEPVEEEIGELPHEVLVLPEPLRRHEPHQEVTVCRVVRRVKCRQLVAERQLVPAHLDDVAHLVALDRRGRPSPGTCTPRCRMGTLSLRRVVGWKGHAGSP